MLELIQKMTVEEFIAFWKDRKNVKNNNPTVGIGMFWEKIPIKDCTVQQYTGKEAWQKIGEFWAPYWGNFTRTTLKEWLNQSRPDYQKFIDEEKVKIEFYDQNGLVYLLFCAFADETGTIGSLGDGSHRYIDCNYLIMKGKDLSGDIKKCRLDVLCVPDLTQILSPLDVPPSYSNS